MSNIFVKVKKFIFDKQARMQYLAEKGFYKNLSDEKYLKKKFKVVMGTKLDLENPKTLCEKLNWLKIYHHRDIYTTMADKSQAKQFVGERIGEDHVIPLLGVWDKFEDIDFDKLPNQFVLKTTHDSGSICVVKDKSKMDILPIKQKLNKSLENDYWASGREWPYKNIKRRIIAEKYIDSLGKPKSIEYKITCFNGKVAFVTICSGIAHAAYELRNNDHYTTDFKKLDWYVNYKPAPVAPSKPEQWDEMIKYAEILSAGVPYLRVDFYLHDGKVLFGEMTFYTWAGFMKFNPPEWDRKLGDMLDISYLQKDIK